VAIVVGLQRLSVDDESVYLAVDDDGVALRRPTRLWIGGMGGEVEETSHAGGPAAA
jgi:hypothetical protein